METAKGRPARRFKKSKIIAFVVGLAVIIIVIAGSVWVFGRTSTASTIDGSKYQAVFFTNGQVYFGKLRQVNREYFSLTNVFYIQAGENGSQSDSNNPQQTSDQNANIELVKLGNEVHGPDDEMVISRDQVLFFENLKKDGKVSSSITQYSQKQ